MILYTPVVILFYFLLHSLHQLFYFYLILILCRLRFLLNLFVIFLLLFYYFTKLIKHWLNIRFIFLHNLCALFCKIIYNFLKNSINFFEGNILLLKWIYFFLKMADLSLQFIFLSWILNLIYFTSNRIILFRPYWGFWLSIKRFSCKYSHSFSTMLFLLLLQYLWVCF